jgi:hypothetical protein
LSKTKYQAVLRRPSELERTLSLGPGNVFFGKACCPQKGFSAGVYPDNVFVGPNVPQPFPHDPFPEFGIVQKFMHVTALKMQTTATVFEFSISMFVFPTAVVINPVILSPTVSPTDESHPEENQP